MQFQPDVIDTPEDELIKSFDLVSPAEKETFNMLIEQEAENYFNSIWRLKPSERSHHGAMNRFELNERLLLIPMLSVFSILFVDNSASFVVLSILLFFLMCLAAMFFIIKFLIPRRKILYRMGIDENDLSPKNRQKMLFLAKVLLKNKYANFISSDDFIKKLLLHFNGGGNQLSFDSLFLHVLENMDDEKERLLKIQKQKQQSDEINLISQDILVKNNQADVDAKMEILNYFAKSIKNEK